jgi:hypothetical protein
MDIFVFSPAVAEDIYHFDIRNLFKSTTAPKRVKYVNKMNLNDKVQSTDFK